MDEYHTSNLDTFPDETCMGHSQRHSQSRKIQSKARLCKVPSATFWPWNPRPEILAGEVIFKPKCSFQRHCKRPTEVSYRFQDPSLKHTSHNHAGLEFKGRHGQGLGFVHLYVIRFHFWTCETSLSGLQSSAENLWSITEENHTSRN